MKRTIRWDRVISTLIAIAFAVSCAFNGTETTVNAVIDTVLAPVDAEYAARDARIAEHVNQYHERSKRD